MRLELSLVDTPASRLVKVAAVQFEPVVGDRSRNLAAMERLIRAAKAKGAEIVVLPELADSGYMFRDAEELSSLSGPIPGGVSAETLSSLSAELSIHVVSGLAERDGDRFFNAAILCGPDGYIGKYRKLHLWNNENMIFQKGDLGLPVFDLPFGRIGLSICYDGWFPETYRTLALKGAELVCVPTNWVPPLSAEGAADSMAEVLHLAAAYNNGIYIACADRIGTERGQAFIGRSVIVGPRGTLSGPASADHEELIVAQIDMPGVAEARSINDFNHLLGDRRVDVYG